MSDGFFDMPAGYSDADLEMAELEDRGRRYSRRMKRFTPQQRETLRTVGATVTIRCRNRDTGVAYDALARTVDEDDAGPIIDYSADNGATWHPTARGARLHATACGRTSN